MTLDWHGDAGDLYIEYSLSLGPANWQTIAGPLRGTNWAFTPVPGARSGFYRVRSQQAGYFSAQVRRAVFRRFALRQSRGSPKLVA